MVTGCGIWAFPLVIFRSVCYMGVKVGGKPPANLPQIDIYGMEAENIKAGNICQPGGRKWWRLGACRMLPQRRDPAAGLGRPRTCRATGLGSFCPGALLEHPREFLSPAQRAGADTENCKG